MRTFCLASVLALSACATDRPYLYGNESCGDERTAFPTADGRAAVCLLEDQVAFVLCARELGLASVIDTSRTTGSMTLNVSELGEGGLEGAAESGLSQYFVSEGKLAEARARAIDACIGLLPASQHPEAGDS